MNALSETDGRLYSFWGRYFAEPKFRERLDARIRRLVLGSAYALRPKRIGLLPRLTALTLAHVIAPTRSTHELLGRAPYRKEGLIGISNDLSVEALLSAYRLGVFPVCHVGPMKWWSPTERAVLFFKDAHVERSTLKQIRQDRFDVTFDHDFAAVMKACAQPRPGKIPLTWLTPQIMQAFWTLHKAGYAHSVEVWDLEPQLVGGMFGIAIGDAFFGESQFSRVTGASKIASAYLNAHLASWGFLLRDAKWMTSHLAGLGFKAIDRDTFLKLKHQNANRPGRVDWGHSSEGTLGLSEEVVARQIAVLLASSYGGG